MLARKLAAVAVVLTILAIGLPAVAEAQHPQANLELGIDLGLISNHEGSLNGTSCSTDCSTFTIAAPVDVRLGFGSGATTFEPRFTLVYVSHAGETDIALAPDANVVVDLGGNPREGAYLTGGMGLKFLSISFRWLERIGDRALAQRRRWDALAVGLDRSGPFRGVLPVQLRERRQGHSQQLRHRCADRPFPVALSDWARIPDGFTSLAQALAQSQRLGG